MNEIRSVRRPPPAVLLPRAPFAPEKRSHRSISGLEIGGNRPLFTKPSAFCEYGVWRKGWRYARRSERMSCPRSAMRGAGQNGRYPRARANFAQSRQAVAPARRPVGLHSSGTQRTPDASQEALGRAFEPYRTWHLAADWGKRLACMNLLLRRAD